MLQLLILVLSIICIGCSTLPASTQTKQEISEPGVCVTIYHQTSGVTDTARVTVDARGRGTLRCKGL